MWLLWEIWKLLNAYFDRESMPFCHSMINHWTYECNYVNQWRWYDNRSNGEYVNHTIIGCLLLLGVRGRRLFLCFLSSLTFEAHYLCILKKTLWNRKVKVENFAYCLLKLKVKKLQQRSTVKSVQSANRCKCLFPRVAPLAALTYRPAANSLQ